MVQLLIFGKAEGVRVFLQPTSPAGHQALSGSLPLLIPLNLEIDFEPPL